MVIEAVTAESPGESVTGAARLLHDFNIEYDYPAPPPDELASLLRERVSAEELTLLLARERASGEPVGVAVMRIQPSVWSRAREAYLAELYVEPSRRGRGYGRELITEAMNLARNQGADYAFVITSEDDRLAQRLYDAAGFRRTEGEGGPVMLAYERDL